MKTKLSLLYLMLVAVAIAVIAIEIVLILLFEDSRFVNEPLHSTMDGLGVLAGIVMAVLLLQRTKAEQGYKFYPLAMGFLGLVLLDGFHGISEVGQGFVLLHGAGSLIGGLWFALVWLPDDLKQKLWTTRKWMPWAIAGFGAALWLWSVGAPQTLPAMIIEGRFTTLTLVLNNASGLLFVAGITGLIKDFHRSRDREIYLLTVMAILFALTAVAFLYTSVWDSVWWLWHTMRLVAYVMILGFVFSDYQRKVIGLREASEYSRNLIEASLDPLVTINPEGKITDVNEATELATGVPRSQLVGSDFSEFFTESHEAKTAYRQALSDGFIKDYPLAMRHRNGTVVDVLYNASIYVSEHGIGVLATARDVTERKKNEERIVSLNRSLEQKAEELEVINQELESFSYSISHDLSAPLRSLDGFSHALLEDYGHKLDYEGRDYLQRTRAASQRMAQLIEDLLRLSRVTRSDMQHEAVDLSALVEKCASELREAQPERAVEFDITPDVSAAGDTQLLKLALDNLVGNAWKFTGKQGQAKIEFGVSERNGERAYFVKDNGAGFDMAYAGKLFGAFQRLHSATEFPGTGIGLAIVQRIVHRHGGQIWAESELEKGTTFYFTLGPRRD